MLGQGGGCRGAVSVGDLLWGRVVDAAVGHGAFAINVEIATVLIPVCPVLEAQSHALVTLARLLVTLCLIELAWGWDGHKALSDGAAATPGYGGTGDTDLEVLVALRM